MLRDSAPGCTVFAMVEKVGSTTESKDGPTLGSGLSAQVARRNFAVEDANETVLPRYLSLSQFTDLRNHKITLF